tara:strand:- start:1575 stop:3284 length:1710 start_codon:yes stop_codon:yes gene_type:complete
MASSGNFCTLNPLDSGATLINGNLTMSHTTSAFRTAFGTLGVSSGKWYFESRQINTTGGNAFPLGVQRLSEGLNNKVWTTNPGQSVSTYGYSYAIYSGGSGYSDKVHNNSYTAMTDISEGQAGDVYQLALDLDNSKIWFGKNNTWHNSGDPAGNSNETYSSVPAGTWCSLISTHKNTNDYFTQNYGQDSTFSGARSAGNNADGNGFGDFVYSPPTGFLALCSANLPISDDIDPAQTDDDYPTKQFNILTYNSSGGDSYTGLGFKPDLVWVKWRGGDQSNALFDSTRGTTKVLNSDATNAEATSSGLTSFDSDGYTMGNSYNQSGREYVGWCWRANGGTTSSNTDGTITSTVQANTKAGFSIVKFTGNGSNNATVGHGLDSAPDFIICKPYGSTLSWHVFHRAMGTGEFILNNNSSFDTRTSSFTESGTTATNFTLGSDASNMNYSGVDTIAYCWHSVEGYSKFGKYEGNGNNDGPFIYMGFRPRMVVIKAADSNQAWYVADTERETFNPLGEKMLSWNGTHGDFDPSGFNFDVVSNGIKIRSSDTNINSSATFTYMAWGDVPFKYNNTF